MTEFNKADWPDLVIMVERGGSSGNAFGIIGQASRVLRAARVPEETILEYHQDAMSSDYDHLIEATDRYVTISWM